MQPSERDVTSTKETFDIKNADEAVIFLQRIYNYQSTIEQLNGGWDDGKIDKLPAIIPAINQLPSLSSRMTKVRKGSRQLVWR